MVQTEERLCGVFPVKLGFSQAYFIWKEIIYIGRKTGAYIECEFCGKSVYKTLSQLKKREHHFCSNKCQALKKRQDTFEHRPCETCGQDMYISKKSLQRFCSIQCQSEWQRGNTGFNHKRFGGGFVSCETCGAEVLLGAYRYNNGKHHFCSSSCRQAWYANCWSQSPEWREQSRSRAVELLSDGSVQTQTKPQIAVNEMLHSLGVSFRNEEPYTYYSIDNYLISCDLLIEVMGDYWHSSPIKFPDKINSIQEKIVKKDKAKHTYISRYYGKEILYLWEHDIKTRPDLCKALILHYIKNDGVLENYNSFNFELDDTGYPVLISSPIISRQEIAS